MRHPFFISALALITLLSTRSPAVQMLNNLGEPPPQSGTIGDIQGIPPDSTIAGRFSTGLGSFTLNSITLEFLTGGNLYPDPLTLQNFHLDLYKQLPGFRNFSLLGPLGSPVLDPTPTIFPGWTTYYSFSPSSQITLDPSSTYALAASDTSGTGYQEGLLFTQSSAAISSDGWQMAFPGYIGPYNEFSAWGIFGEYMKFAVDATPVPEPACLPLAFIACSVALLRRTQSSPRERQPTIS